MDFFMKIKKELVHFVIKKYEITVQKDDKIQFHFCLWIRSVRMEIKKVQELREEIIFNKTENNVKKDGVFLSHNELNQKYLKENLFSDNEHHFVNEKEEITGCQEIHHNIYVIKKEKY